MAETVALGDRDMTGQDHEHAQSGLAGLEQPFAVLVMDDIAEPADARDFLQRQRREGLLMTRKRGRRLGFSTDVIFSRVCIHLVTLADITQGQNNTDPTRSFAGLFVAPVIWRDVIAIGRCAWRIASAPRLGLSPLEIFAQRLLQPLLSPIAGRTTGLAVAFVPMIRHRGPVRPRGYRNGYAGRMDRWAKYRHWRLCRSGLWTIGIALSRPAITACWPPCCRNILCFA